jgi:D-3-phosphoglycerate dehydrogenase
MKRILVTPRSLAGSKHPAIQLLWDQGWEIIFGPTGRLPDGAELLQLVPGCEGWLAGVEQMTIQVLEAADQLKVISRNGSGVDNIPLKHAKQRGIAVLNAAGANAQGVAELTLGLALAAIRQLHLADRRLKEGEWIRTLGGELNGKQVLVVGFGRIGKIVSRLFAAFGSSVSIVEPLEVTTEPFPKVELVNGLRSADLVTLRCPPPEDEHTLLTAERLKTVRSGCILINCARRSLVDEKALLAGLEAGVISVYASDVFEEAGAHGTVLNRHSKVIATPHLGAYTKESVDRAALEAAQNLIRFFGHAPR